MGRKWHFNLFKKIITDDNKSDYVFTLDLMSLNKKRSLNLENYASIKKNVSVTFWGTRNKL